MTVREQRTFAGWAKFSLKSEMCRHYEQMITAFSRVANEDLNLEIFSPEQKIFVHDFMWNRIWSKLLLNLSASLAHFVSNLLLQQLVVFSPANARRIIYESKEDDFSFVVETLDLDTVLPKNVGHARIQNFFAILAKFSNKKMDLYKITRVPLSAEEIKAVYTVKLPHYLSIGKDGSSSQWFDHKERKCTADKTSNYMFCTVPVLVFTSIQHPCLRG